MIVERVNSGLARAKAKGVKLGRGNKKDGAWSVDEERWGMTRAELEERILRLAKDGTGILKIAKALGVGTALVQGVVRPLEAAAQGAGRGEGERQAGDALRNLRGFCMKSARFLRAGCMATLLLCPQKAGIVITIIDGVQWGIGGCGHGRSLTRSLRTR